MAEPMDELVEHKKQLAVWTLAICPPAHVLHEVLWRAHNISFLN